MRTFTKTAGIIVATGILFGVALAPTFDLSVPANTYRSNYSAEIGSTAVTPYVSTITFTIAERPFSPDPRLGLSLTSRTLRCGAFWR